MKYGSFIGIDFGTTNTAVVHIISDKLGSRITHLGDEGEYPFSSIVAIPKDGGPLLFGRYVRQQRQELSQTHDIYLSMKPYLGTDHEFIVGGHRYSAVDVTAEFLKYIKQYISEHYSVRIDRAAFSFPVDFSPAARRDLMKAAKKAGIEPAVFVSESTAAYIANRAEGRPFSRVIVIDWGGGTLDISILELKQTKVYERSVWGERIGGDDIDKEFAQRVHAMISVDSSNGERIKFEEMSPAQQDQLIMYCERAKIDFSQYDDDYPLTVTNYGVYGTKTRMIPFDKFVQIIKPIVQKALATVEIALERARLTSASIDAVILVGGSSNLRPFAKAITQAFGREKIILPDSAQWSVAEGAALMQPIEGHFALNDDVGVLLSDDSVYLVLEHNKDGVGSKAGPITFSLTEDVPDAHFIFTNQDASFPYARITVPTKGFLKEELKLSGSIGPDQIAVMIIDNSTMGVGQSKTIEINKLTFHYDLAELDA